MTTTVTFLTNEDRLAYIDGTELGTFIPEMSINFSTQREYGIFDPYPRYPSEGETFVVRWNGVDYTLQAHETQVDRQSFALAMVLEDESGNAPFEKIHFYCQEYIDYEYFEGYYTRIFVNQNISEPVTVEIFGQVEKIKPIDLKFMPEEVKDLLNGTTGSEGLPTPEGPNLQLVTDADGNWTQVERLTWTEDAQYDILPETDVAIMIPEDSLGAIAAAPTQAVEVGKTYVVTYNGVPYTCVAQMYEEDGTSAVALGNLGAMTGMSPTDEPFIIICVPPELGATEGYYFIVFMMHEVTPETEVRVKIEFNDKIVKPIDPEYFGALRGQKTITLTPDTENNGFIADASFGTAWAMDEAELQNAIRIDGSEGAYTSGMSVCAVSKVNVGNIRAIQMLCMSFNDYESHKWVVLQWFSGNNRTVAVYSSNALMPMNRGTEDAVPIIFGNGNRSGIIPMSTFKHLLGVAELSVQITKNNDGSYSSSHQSGQIWGAYLDGVQIKATLIGGFAPLTLKPLYIGENCVFTGISYTDDGADGMIPQAVLVTIVGDDVRVEIIDLAEREKVENLEARIKGIESVSGTGLPVPEGPNLALGTNANGEWEQEEKLAYSTTGMVEILPETTLVITSAVDSMAVITEKPTQLLEVGKTYTVVWNGTSYTCVAQEFSEDGGTTTALGNIDAFTGADTGEPFVILYAPPEMTGEEGYYFLVIVLEELTESSEITVKITGEGVTYKKISFDYLPDGVGGIEYGVVLPETTAEYNEDMGGMMVTDPLNMPITADNAYTVVWNGTEYKCVAQEYSEDGMTTSVLGNIGAAMGGAGTGEPFIIIDYSAMGMGISLAIMTLDGSTTATLSISGETIKKIDPKYIDAEWMAVTEDVGEEIVPPTFKKDGDSYYRLASDIAEQLTAGAEIVVYIDGYRYESKMMQIEGFVYAGNIGIFAPELGDNGEPYCIMIAAENVSINFSSRKAACFAIYKQGKAIQMPKVIPKKFLSNIGTLYVNMTEPVVGEYVSDRTYNDIELAVGNEMSVVCKLMKDGFPIFMQLVAINVGNGAQFSSVLVSGGKAHIHTASISQDNTITYFDNEWS